MKPQDEYLNLLLRTDRLQSIVSAMNRFLKSRTDDEAQHILATIIRLHSLPCPVALRDKP